MMVDNTNGGKSVGKLKNGNTRTPTNQENTLVYREKIYGNKERGKFYEELNIREIQYT